MRPVVGVLSALLCLCTGEALAQDMNYDPFQVGGRSALMGGAVVGGVRDSSAVVYNPGALAFVEEANVSAAASLLRYGQLRVRDALGNGQNVEADVIDVVPLLVSGSFRPGPSERFALGYAITARQQLSASFRGATRTVAEVPAVGLPGDETFLGLYEDGRRVDETWGMVAGAWRLTDRIAVGGGPILALRRESRRQRISTNLENTSTSPATSVFSLSQLLDASFYQVSLLGKVGAAWEPSGRLKLGATVTSPGLKVYGNGEELAEILLATSIPGIGDADLSSLERDLDTNHRVPLRASVGAEVVLSPRWTVGVAVEYVDGLGGKPVIRTDPDKDFFKDTPQFIGNSSNLQLLDKRHPVVNVSLGVEYRVNERYSAYAGFWTDFSPVDIHDLKEMLARDDIGSPIALSSVDVYNFALGASRRAGSRMLAAGLAGAYGTGRAAGTLDFVDPSALISAGGLPAVAERKVTYFTGSLLVSFTQYF